MVITAGVTPMPTSCISMTALLTNSISVIPPPRGLWITWCYCVMCVCAIMCGVTIATINGSPSKDLQIGVLISALCCVVLLYPQWGGPVSDSTCSILSTAVL